MDNDFQIFYSFFPLLQ